MRAQNRETVSADVSQFVPGLISWYLVLTAPRKCALRSGTGPSGNGGIYGTFTGVHYIWLRARLLQPWRQLLAMASASVIAILPNARTSAGATKWRAWNCIEQYVCRTGRKLCRTWQRVQEKTAGLEHKNQILSFYGRLTAVCIPAPRCVNACHLTQRLTEFNPAT